MSQAARPATLGLWPAVWKLLRLQAQIQFSGFRRASARSKVGYALLALLSLSFLVFVFVMSFLFLRFLRSPELAEIVPEAASFLASVPVLIVQVGFLIILATSFGVLLQALYLAGDMDFLLSTPLPARAVFVYKLLLAILPNLGLFSLIAVPVLFGLGASGGYSLLYYPLVVLMLITLALAAAGLSSLVVMAVARIFPARRVAEVLGAVGGVAAMLCSQSGQFARFGKTSPEQVSSALRLLERFDVAWSPLAWAGRGLVSIGEGHWPAGLGFSLLALGSAGLLFGLALTTAERLYYSGWAGMKTAAQGRKKAPRAARPARPRLALVERALPADVGSIVIKDWTVLRRDLRNLSQLITPLILGLVYAFLMLRSGEPLSVSGGEAPAWLAQALQSGLAYASIGISLFVGWTLLSRLATMGFAQEGKSYWMVKSAPVSVERLLAAKFLAAYLPALALSWAFVVVLALLHGRGSPAPTHVWFSLAVVALCLAATDGIYLAFGVKSAKFDWEDPRQMVSGSTGCLGVLATGVAIVVALALFAGPQIGLVLLGWPALAAQLVGLALGGAFCLACALLPLRLVRTHVPRLGE